MQDSGDKGEYQSILSSINSGEYINNRVWLYEYDSDRGVNACWMGNFTAHDNKSKLNLPPVLGDKDPGGPYDNESDPNS